MAWNPSPKVSDCRTIGQKWQKQMVIIIAIDDDGAIEMASFGETKRLCYCAAMLGNTAWEAIKQRVALHNPFRKS